MSTYRMYKLKRVATISDRKDRLSSLATILTGKDATKQEVIENFKNNVALIYKKFMQDGDALKSLKKIEHLRDDFDKKDMLETTYELFKVLDKKFTDIVSNIDVKDLVETVVDLRGLNDMVEEFRPKIRLEIDNDTTLTSVDRKHLGATFDRVLDGIQRDIGRLVRGERIGEDRIRMKQTATQMQSFILEYGPLYGIHSMDDWGKLRHGDHALSEDVLTKFLGLRRKSMSFKKDEYYDESDPKNKAKLIAELKSSVDHDLKRKVEEFLHPEPVMILPFGNLPKRPPGK